MITLGGQILRCDVDGATSIRPGTVEIRDGLISDVHLGDVSSRVNLGNSNCLICPGFIDTHLHLPQFDSIGVAGLRLLDWLDQVIFPAETKWNDLTWAEAMIERVAGQCLSVGTTGICGYSSVHHPATMAALQRFSDIGFRGVIGQVLMDRGAPPELLRPVSQLIDEAGRTLERFPSVSRLAAAITPRFALSCSSTLMEQAAHLADSHHAIVQSHLAETTAECEEVCRLFDRPSYVDVYDEAGLLGPRSLFGHGIHLSQNEPQRLADSGSIIAHCPTANSFLGSGAMNRHAHRSVGIPITLGSDIGAGFERSMVRVGRAMIETTVQLARQAGSGIGDAARIPSAADAWYQITAGNADALGWSDVGRIERKMSADVLVIRPDIPWLDSPDPLSTLMFAWDDRWLKATILRGRVRYARDDGNATLQAEGLGE